MIPPFSTNLIASPVHSKPAANLTFSFSSILERIGRLFSFFNPRPATGIVQNPLKEDDFTMIEGNPKPAPLTGILENVKKIFKSTSVTVYESLLSSPLNGHVDLNLSNGMVVAAQLKFADKVTCDMTLSLAPTATVMEKEQIEELHPLLTALLDQSITDKLKSLDQLKGLINAFPRQQTSIEWMALEHRAVLNIELPGNAHLSINLKFSEKLDTLADDLPTFMSAMIPPEAYEMFPGIKPLLSENFRFEWNGETSKFALEFESRQVINLTSLELKGNLLIRLLGLFLGKTLKINLPRRIAGHIDPKTLAVQFDQDTSFKVKLNKLEKLGKFVNLENIHYDKASNILHIDLKCFGMHPKIAIDLNTSIIDKKGFKFVSKRDEKREYSASILQKLDTAAATPNSSNTYLEGIKSTLRGMVPSYYQSLFDIFINTKSSGNLTFNLQDKSIGATFNLADEVTCKTTIKFPSEDNTQNGIDLNEELLKQIKTKLQGAINENYNIDEIISLLLKLPTQATILNWEGKLGKATVNMYLPGGAVFTVELMAPKLIGQSVQEVPPTMEKILSKFLFKELFTSFRPFLSSDFALTWNGQNSEFSLKFKNEQQVHIQEIVLPQKGTLATLAKFVGDNTFIKLPTELKGKINFKDLSIEFTPMLTFHLKSGLIGKEFDLKKIQYDAQDPRIKLDYNFFGSHSQMISLKKSTPEVVETDKKILTKDSTPEVKVKFSVGPVVPKAPTEPTPSVEKTKEPSLVNTFKNLFKF